MDSLTRFAKRSAAAGAAAWLLLLLAHTSDSPETELIHKIVFFGVLVVVPLGLSLVPTAYQPNRVWIYRSAVLAQPVAAIPTVLSFFLDHGLLSAAFSSAWLILTILVALTGLTRFAARGLYPLAESAIDAGLLYLPIAGAWLVVYRLGVQPLGSVKQSSCSQWSTFTLPVLRLRLLRA